MIAGLAPEFVAILEGIQVVPCRGDRESACQRYGVPKHAYSSAACARRALLAWSWRHCSPLGPENVVYECAHCGWWHHGRQHVPESEAA